MTISDRDRIGTAASAAVTHRIVENARDAGIDQRDPLWPFVETLCHATAEISETSAEVRKAGADVVAEMRRAHGRMDAQERLIFRTLVVRTARRTAARWTAIAFALIVAGHIGFWFGHVAPATTDRWLVQSADTSAEDQMWLQLRSWNNLSGALDACHSEVDSSDTGKPRRFCRLLLWIEPRR